MEDDVSSEQLSFELAEDQKSVELVLSLSDSCPSQTSIQTEFQSCKFKDCLYREDLIAQVLADFKQKQDATPNSAEVMRYKIADRKSATLHLEVSGDRLTASLVITAAFGGNNPNEKLILAYLRKQGIKEGIQLPAIREYCSQANSLTPGAQTTVVVAKGQAAKKGIACEFKWAVTPFQDRELKPVQREDGTIDMYDMGDIETVSPGDVVMERIPARKSDDGINVYGEPIFSIAPPNLPFSVAEGVEVSEDNPNQLLATRSGVPMRSRDVIRVDDILVLETVDLTTGHIKFDGTVMIKGPVRDGLKVEVTGDIHVRDLVESATLIAGGNILVKQGILGRKVESEDGYGQESSYNAIVDAKGDIEASYLQFVSIKTGGKITVKDQMLSCLVKECEELVVGGPTKRKAKLVGGQYKVRRSVSVGILGSDSYVPADIELGTDVARLKEELEEIKNTLLEKQDSLARCTVQLEKNEQKGDQKKIDHFTQVIARIRNEAQELKEQYETLSQQYKELVMQVSVSVYGECFPGIQFKFGKFNTTLQDYSKACRFKFTKMGLKKSPLK
ncbi:FapA family protein [Litoribrevibacter euphylliae]|uniref:FapA family protein n=1 Tax=Litoribrevibacter euphylliae TaxID=1834034 RepID=A0ABV7HKD4_9GAMM